MTTTLTELTGGKGTKPGYYSIGKESLESMIQAGRFNRALQLTYTLEPSNITFTANIGSGYRDDITVFQIDEETIAVLSMNSDLPCICLETYQNGEITASVGFQEHECSEIAHDWEKLSRLELTRLLLEYCY